MITDRIGLHEVSLPINYEKTQFVRREVYPSYERKRKFAFKD